MTHRISPRAEILIVPSAATKPKRRFTAGWIAASLLIGGLLAGAEIRSEVTRLQSLPVAAQANTPRIAEFSNLRTADASAPVRIARDTD